MLYREARDIDHLVTGNPFAELRWQKPPRKKPDRSRSGARHDFCLLRPERPWHPFDYFQSGAVRPRKFYATRHTFISVALSKGCNLKWVAEYCGTSVEMIEKSYGKFIADDGAEPLIRSLRGAKIQTQPANLRRKSA